jgi:threonyl-tRNA synthetase
MWLAPVQVVVTTITEAADAAARDVQARFRTAGIRADLDLRNEKINYKVREHSLAKIPVICVLGEREAENATVSLRRLGDNRQEVLALEEAVARLTRETAAPSP